LSFCFIYVVSNSNKPFNVCSFEKILLLVVDVFWYSSSGDALAFAYFGSSSHCNIFLVTLEIMCHLNLKVWTNTLSICLFCLFLYINFFVCYVVDWA
jgi:hypothetical protein